MRTNRKKTKKSTIVILVSAIVVVQFAIFFVWRSLDGDEESVSKDAEIANPVAAGSKTESVAAQPAPEKPLEVEQPSIPDDIEKTPSENSADTEVAEIEGIGSDNSTGDVVDDVPVGITPTRSISNRNQPLPNETRRQKIARDRKMAKEARAKEKFERKRAAVARAKARQSAQRPAPEPIVKKAEIVRKPLPAKKKNGSNVLTPDLENNPYMHE